MKYIIELEKLEGTGLYKAKGANTLVFDKKGIENILKPLLEPETDWSKVAVDTPILVSNDGETWRNRHFAKCENSCVYAWDNGQTSFTVTADNSCDYTFWPYAKLAEVEK